MIRKSLIIPMLLTVSLGMSGCSEKSDPAAAKSGATAQPSPSDGPPAGEAELKYFDCLKKNGLAVETTDAGEPRLAKTDPEAKVAAAEKACAALKPAGAPQQINPEQLAKEQQWADCLRRQGLGWVPDPNPSTGVLELTPQQSADLKTKHTNALRECQSDAAKKNTGPGVVGG
ncbi:hypothetical protein OG625_08370 [Streptomyces sp. NBC_01351]|uniref:hypothetical protein n=1 Tax=Streptomyces sp. NBC_01351 TaxID=2903833 RepID=UPI002E34CA9A|nr:hypothetical protein [Streptomyces sp. NBC_01351]